MKGKGGSVKRLYDPVEIAVAEVVPDNESDERWLSTQAVELGLVAENADGDKVMTLVGFWLMNCSLN